jgi:branched-chain amino acid transport system permease protein
VSARSWRADAAGLALGVALVILLLGVESGSSTQTVMLTLLIYAGLAQSWNLIGGFGGQISLGHSVFVGVGGYVTAMLLIKSGLPVAAVLALSGAACALVAVLSAPLLLRLHGVYLAIGTLALALAVQAWMLTWDYTGASKGLNIPFDRLPSPDGVYRLALGFAVLATVIAWWMSRSRFGLRLKAVRDDEGAASGLGVDVTRVKVTAYALSAGLTGLVGTVIALNQISIVPNNQFGIQWTIEMVVMAMIGGAGTIWGPPLGAFVVYYLIEYQLQDDPTLAAVLTGLLVVAVVRFSPGGIANLLSGLYHRLRTARGARQVVKY